MHKIRLGILALTALLCVQGCYKDSRFEPGIDGATDSARQQPGRMATENPRRVMIMVSAGYNSLYSYLDADLADLESGLLPSGTGFGDDVLLVLCRQLTKRDDYNTPRAPVLYRLWSSEGLVHRDTLRMWPDDTPLCRRETIHEALSLVCDKFPASSYGMVFSSHATGWMPARYYSNPDTYEQEHGGTPSGGGVFFKPRFVSPVQHFPPLEAEPAVKSIGQDQVGTASVEMELQEFADAIPMRLDYLLIDACLCGGVEVAYALRDKADIVGFSPTEILADGFVYHNITSHLFASEPDPVGVCREYFEQYNVQTGSSRSATISVVDTREMEPLAAVCRELFEKYRDVIETLPGTGVQGYFRFDRHFFYDLKDILVQAGISAGEQARLEEAMDRCILYKAATPSFLSIGIRRYSGLSMYLPSMGTDLLDSFYRQQISWNDATELVK